MNATALASGDSQKQSSSLRFRLALVAIISILTGSYWDLSWCMALPLIGLLFPVGMPIIITRLFPTFSGGKLYGIFVVAIILSEVFRNLLYVIGNWGQVSIINKTVDT